MSALCANSMCNCACHTTTHAQKTEKTNRIRRDIGQSHNWSVYEVYNILDRFQHENGYIPRNMLNTAKEITMDKHDAVRQKNKGQKILWGRLIFYAIHQNENLMHKDYMRSNGEMTLDGRYVEYYIRKWLIPHRAGIAKRKAGH